MGVWLSMSMSYVGPGDYANTSKVAVSVDVHWDSTSYNGNSPPLTVTVDGVNDSVSVSFNTGKTSSGSQNIYSRYWNVGHDANGSARTVYASASYATGTMSGTISTSSSLSLAAIGGSGGGDSGDDDDDSGGDSGGNTGGTGGGSDDEPGSDLLIHPDTNCTYLGTAHYGGYGNVGLGGYDRPTASSPLTIKFKTPSDLVSSNSVTVRLTNYGVYWNEYDNGYNISFELYEGTQNNDEGYLTWASGIPSGSLNTIHSSYDVVIPTNELKPDTEYVIAVRSYAANFVRVDAPVGIIIDYVARGGVHIKTNDVIQKYFSYIKKGDNYDLYEPYIKNGSNWDIYGNEPAF